MDRLRAGKKRTRIGRKRARRVIRRNHFDPADRSRATFCGYTTTDSGQEEPMRLAGILVCALLSLAQVVHAADGVAERATRPPTRIPLAGLLPTLTGEPRQGEVTLVLSIYAERDSAAPLWSEEQTVVLGNDGRYEVALGATSEEGLSSELFSTNGARWIGIGEKGSLEQPRFMLVSVPYATKALDADAIGGRRVKDFVLAEELDEKVVSVLARGQTVDPAQGATTADPRTPAGVRSFVLDLNPRSDADAAVAAAGRFTSEASTGLMFGVHAHVHSTSGGSADSAPTAVYGEVAPTAPGGFSAGVRGINRGTGGLGVGVVGVHGGSGWGIFGSAPSGIGAYGSSSAGFGVYGSSTNGVGVLGTGSGAGPGVRASHGGGAIGTALEIENGRISVAGVNRAAFVHTATEGIYYTVIDHPFSNGQPGAILHVTQRASIIAGPSGPIMVCCGVASFGVGYNANIAKWLIMSSGDAIPAGVEFNVLVINQ
jgi:hypothetical protein